MADRGIPFPGVLQPWGKEGRFGACAVSCLRRILESGGLDAREVAKRVSIWAEVGTERFIGLEAFVLLFEGESLSFGIPFSCSAAEGVCRAHA